MNKHKREREACLGEAVANHLGNKNLTKVFPGFDKSTPKDFLKYPG
jgi:hypothetical protein